MTTTPTLIRADRSQPANVSLQSLEWTPSPLAGVDRKMLERNGDEVALATTVVRYAPDSSFSSHTHARGEEFLVLEGVFSDEHGSYPPGTYIRNPPGSKHTPFSKEGCTIFVKLRYMKLSETERVVVDTNTATWITSDQEGHTLLRLFMDPEGDEDVTMERLAEGASVSWEIPQGGEEILVVEGDLTTPKGTYTQGTWLRHPQKGTATYSTSQGCLLWIKRRHLPSPA
ncbi:MAG: cupin [Deltaproteobacteria bacterium]|nr:MAG: cupin [Deltaproteobacteria bacterium]